MSEQIIDAYKESAGLKFPDRELSETNIPEGLSQKHTDDNLEKVMQEIIELTGEDEPYSDYLPIIAQYILDREVKVYESGYADAISDYCGKDEVE